MHTQLQHLAGGRDLVVGHRAGRDRLLDQRLVLAEQPAAHPAVVEVIAEHEDWASQLARQIGGAVELRGDAALPMSGGYAEGV